MRPSQRFTIIAYALFVAAQALFLAGAILLERIVYFGPVLLPKILAQSVFLKREELTELIALAGLGGLFGFFVALMVILTPIFVLSLLLISASWILQARQRRTKWIIPAAGPAITLALAYPLMPAVPDFYLGHLANIMGWFLVLFIILQSASLLALFLASRRRVYLSAGLLAIPGIAPAAYSLLDAPEIVLPIINIAVAGSLAASSAMALLGLIQEVRSGGS